MLQMETSNGLPHCANTWKSCSGDQEIRSTSQLCSHPSKRTDYQVLHEADNSAGGLFVLPEYNFAVCLFPKVGSTMWSDVLLKMVTHNASAAGKEYWDPIAKDFTGTVDEKKLVFSDPNSVRALFVRDPLARFASTFLNKCAAENISCGINTMKWAVTAALEAHRLGRYLNHDNNNDNRSDFHWRPQSSFCDINNSVEEFTFIGLYKPETFGQDSACLMEVAGLQEYNTMGDLNNTPFWGREQKFTGDRVPINLLHSDNTKSENELMQKLYTPQAALDIMQVYKIDYATFNLPEPAWIEGATGELYDLDLSQASSVE